MRGPACERVTDHDRGDRQRPEGLVPRTVLRATVSHEYRDFARARSNRRLLHSAEPWRLRIEFQAADAARLYALYVRLD